MTIATASTAADEIREAIRLTRSGTSSPLGWVDEEARSRERWRISSAVGARIDSAGADNHYGWARSRQWAKPRPRDDRKYLCGDNL